MEGAGAIKKEPKLLYEDATPCGSVFPQPKVNFKDICQNSSRIAEDIEDDFDDDEMGDDEEDRFGPEDEALYELQKLAGIELNDKDISDFKRMDNVKHKVIDVLGKKYYGRMRFAWSSVEESCLEQYLLINGAKTKIPASPLVDIFEAVSKISDENDALEAACQVVSNKISSLYE
jgi:hypothetical protein